MYLKKELQLLASVSLSQVDRDSFIKIGLVHCYEAIREKVKPSMTNGLESTMT